MAGTMTRDGRILEAPELDAETRSRMLDAIVAAFLERHPEAIREAVDKLTNSQ